ncbi:MAG: sulfatase, partial [Armatimonadota bacterium]
MSSTHSRRQFLAAAGALAAGVGSRARGPGPKRPNIIWIITEDQSRHYGCYGEPLVNTPRIDRLADDGAKFTNAMVTCPVCSPSRSALITGMYQTTIGAHHHRSGRGTERIQLPDHVKLIPEYFQEAGYYTCLGHFGHVTGGAKRGGLGKSDYNFEWDQSVYDGNEWSGRSEGQPFFAQIMLGGGKSRGQARRSKDIPHVKPEDVVLPPYYPRHPVILEDWAAYLDTFSLMDHQVGRILERLEREGIVDDTVIFFLTDHGVSHARGKQFLYDEGIMVPLIVSAPGRIEPGTVRDDPVAHIDMAAASLHFAGIPIPQHLEARPLFSPDHEPREYVVSARDRCDETYDRIRGVRTRGFKYIRNGYPLRPHLQPCVYKDEKPIYKALREWQTAGKLDAVQERLLFAPRRAEEELYDL